MNIIEVKNNLVKLCYEDELVLSGFIKIDDTNKSYIAQILHLEATRIGKVAIAKIIFNYNNGISAYDGSIPSLRAELQPVDTSILLETLDKTNPLNLGKLAEQKHNIIVNLDVLKDNPIICAEKFFTTKVLLNNFALQLQARKQKIVVFDTSGIFKTNKLTITKDFKLPLNSSTINYIYEKGFVDATAESKAMIQAIFEELSEYSKTVEFIPFDTFKAVVDSEFMRTKLIQLVILKNKIKQIRDWNVFAQNEAEFNVLKEKFKKDETIVIDISCLKESLQKECIKYVYSVLKGIDAEFYAFTPLSNDNSDKFLLKQIIDTENVHTTTICGYDYKLVNELKKRSKNMLMFTPLKQQRDFGGYNIFLQKLAEDEFIAYGKMTKFVPLIGKLHQLSTSEIYIPKVKETIQQIQQPTIEPKPIVEPVITNKTPIVEPQIETPVQSIEQPSKPITTEEVQPIPVEPVQIEEPQPEPVQEIQPQPQEETEKEQVAEPVQQPTLTFVDDEEENEEEIIQETQVTQPEQPVQEEPIVKEVQPTPVEEIQTPTAEVVETPEIVDEIPANEPIEEITEVPVEQPIQPQVEPQPVANEVEAALNEVPDIEDDEELSDDDLDMIEELSKPDEEIQAINPVEPQIEPQQEPVQEIKPQPQQNVQPEPQPQPQVQPQPQAEHPVDKEIQNAQMPNVATPEPLQTRANTTHVVPDYPSNIPDEDKVKSDVIQQGDRVMHQEFGEGVVEKMINYGDKLLCSVNFASVGRRLLNPEISEMKKI